jgi:excisionase family DNA binding protein
MVIEQNAVYRIGEVAKLLSVSEGTVRNFLRDGLPHKKVRSIIFIRGEELLDYMSSEQSSKDQFRLARN